MPDKHETIRVVGLHRLPFDKEAFERDACLDDHPAEVQAEVREQIRENWENAWLVVVEFAGRADDLGFESFRHGPGSIDGQQAAWEEAVLHQSPDTTTAAFYLHCVTPGEPLWYGDEAISFPAPTAPSAELLRQLPYTSPD